ncbi:GABA transporter 1, partial [Mucuna pruriens]
MATDILVIGGPLVGGKSLKFIYQLYNPDGSTKLYQFIIICGVVTLILAQLPSFHSLRHINLISLIHNVMYATCVTIGSIVIGKERKTQWHWQPKQKLVTQKTRHLGIILGSSLHELCRSLEAVLLPIRHTPLEAGDTAPLHPFRAIGASGFKRGSYIDSPPTVAHLGKAPSLGVFFWFFASRKTDRVGWTFLSNRPKRSLLRPFSESYKGFKDHFFRVAPRNPNSRLLVDREGRQHFPLQWTRRPAVSISVAVKSLEGWERAFIDELKEFPVYRSSDIIKGEEVKKLREEAAEKELAHRDELGSMEGSLKATQDTIAARDRTIYQQGIDIADQYVVGFQRAIAQVEFLHPSVDVSEADPFKEVRDGHLNFLQFASNCGTSCEGQNVESTVSVILLLPPPILVLQSQVIGYLVINPVQQFLLTSLVRLSFCFPNGFSS